ncbi:MAG: copper chaperone PCu(A)C [Microvirga sp.]|nr:copper chaperone PCu(A)C [Microvirga sp.]MCE3246815.1 copper chaperone PCu(A)C [Geminicoccaceae bacterium]MDF2971807.1 copper chaperone PCu(A)C [Microvirga sp.]
MTTFLIAARFLALAALVWPTIASAQTSPGSYRAGEILVESPWSRASPGGAKVASGYMRITNTGSTPERLLGGSADVAGGFEVHRSIVSDGIARMEPLPNGLEIKPGETVELRPGGSHGMLVDLKRPLKEGERVKGTLVFERAGTVDIEYRIAGIGAKSPPR